MGSAECALLTWCMLVALGLLLGDGCWISQKKFCCVFDKREVRFRLLPGVGQSTNFSHHYDLYGTSRAYRFS